MPVNDLGYRKWEGEIGSPFFRWLAIARAGIKIVYKSQWIKRLMFFAWVPALIVGILFFFYEQYVDNFELEASRSGRQLESSFNMNDRDDLIGYAQVVGILGIFSSSRNELKDVMEFTTDPNGRREKVWSFILLQLLRRSQGFMVLVLIGLIAPPLIARDIRSRAFLFYFSKPISRIDYLVGKFAVLGFFVGFVTLLPVLALYLFGVLLSPGLDVLASTWYLPFKASLACLIGIVPGCIIGMFLSSLTSESRFAGFAWFMVWILGWVGYQIVVNVQQTMQMGEMAPDNVDSYWRLISLYDCLGFLQGYVMNVGTYDNSYVITLLFFVIAICVFCVVTILKKISAPLKA